MEERPIIIMETRENGSSANKTERGWVHSLISEFLWKVTISAIGSQGRYWASVAARPKHVDHSLILISIFNFLPACRCSRMNEWIVAESRATEKVNSICVRQIGRFLSNWLALDLCRAIGFFAFSSTPAPPRWLTLSRAHRHTRTSTTWGEESGTANVRMNDPNSEQRRPQLLMSRCPGTVSDMDGLVVVGGCKSSIADHFVRLVTNEIQFIKTRPCSTISFIFVDLIASVIGETQRTERPTSQTSVIHPPTCRGMQISWQRRERTSIGSIEGWGGRMVSGALKMELVWWSFWWRVV